ncbi:aryl-alcohol dehydrogenase [Altererythrobacter atlanticus]|uniref:Aryl-alcohol dehydrogenase n=1 Tax=Croceibacterium atlanticum TaxID=1267766 RepID=A0A0F7KPX5_9SPHN|nr:NAD(P)-dependent alcohol dehydrogenase [Croceibacterium atlanticum]AKH42588.1 Aryl-alcohol dehydrogenase [Croceibacterium atlanticum]MBB5731365.1 aryl-alcohol dehydrogenase [Croceibacterium atlanticum]
MTDQSPIHARAAICRGNSEPFAIQDVTLDALRPEELRIRVVACGICHTDLAVRDKQLPVPLPVVLGHEGAGIVEEVGSDVTVAKPGDRVVMSFNSCGHCPSCAVDAPTYCYEFFPHNWSGMRADGSPTLFADGEPMNANFFGQSSFATQAIAHERNVVKVPESAADIPLERLAPIGCGLMTGAGAVLRSMKVRAGLPIAIFGTGTVGMAAIMAAKIAGADPIIAVDVNDNRLAVAKELGATHAFNAKDDAIGKIRELCPQGLGYVFDTTGINKVIQDAWSLLAPMGICGIVGASDPADNLTFNEAEFMGGGRRVMGILGGDSDLVTFLPDLIAYHQEGRFPFEKLIGYFNFDQINEAIEASESGEVVKPVLKIGSED